MRVLSFPEFGTAAGLADIERPAPGNGEVLVKVAAASVNGFDRIVAAGYLDGMMEHRFPVVIGKDFAGTVAALGKGVTDFAVGDRVFGVVTKSFLGDGSFGEYVTVPVAVGVAVLPDGVDFTEGAALGLAGTTAATAVAAADLGAGSVVLITGATGGVGNQAVQLAAATGAHVIGTGRTEEGRELVADLGAAEVIDYTAGLNDAVLATHPDGVDVVLHFAGDAGGVLSLVKAGGRLVSALVQSPEQLPSDTVTVVPVFANPTPEILDRLATDQASGATRIVIQQTYSLENSGDALTDFGKGTLGNLVVTI